MLRAVQLAHALDDQATCSCAFDFRAHLVQKICKIDNFRFLRCAFDHGCSFREHRGHHHVVRAENRRPKFAPQIDDRAGQFRCKDFYVAPFHAYRRTERFESFKM